MVVAIISLVVATAGTATAAIVVRSSSQVATGAINSGDIKDGVVSSKDLRKGGVKLENLESAARNAVSAAQTKAVETFRKVGPVDQPKGDPKRVATVHSIDPGIYAIFAKTTLSGRAAAVRPARFPGRPTPATACSTPAARRTTRGSSSAVPGFNAPGTLHLQITKTFSTSAPIALDCDVAETQWGASDTSIIAIKVGAAPRQSVDG